MYGSGIDRARDKYKNPSWVHLYPNYGRWWRRQQGAYTLYSARHHQVIGYNIAYQSMVLIAKSLGLKEDFNGVGAEKIKHLLLSWTEEQWELQHARDIIEYGSIKPIIHWVYRNGKWVSAELLGNGFMLPCSWGEMAFDYQI